MKYNRSEKMIQIQTGNRQQSDIDVYSKLQSNFLEKYFKYNLTDYFSDMFTNLYQDFFDRKINIKQQKSLISSLLVSKCQIKISQLENVISQFYKNRSKSVKQSQLPFAFHKVYPNSQKSQITINKQQLILIDVKIKAEVQKIIQAPQKLCNSLKNLKQNQYVDNSSQLENIFNKYKKQTFNIFFVYFGDVNFNAFKKQHYEVNKITIFGKTYQVRIFAFFISKQALIQSFIFLNKIDNLVHINDLVIQFYQLKREKQRRKRFKQNEQKKLSIFLNEPNNSNQNNIDNKLQINYIAIGIMVVVGLMTFGVVIKKLLF